MGRGHHAQLVRRAAAAFRRTNAQRAPVLGQGNYRSVEPALYLCGASSHPGGGVSGLPGRNAAREILRDLHRTPRPSVTG